MRWLAAAVFVTVCSAGVAQMPVANSKIAPTLAQTPPMGWNSWNHFAGKVTQQDVMDAADALVKTGMRDAGYVYVNIDDTWEGERDAKGVLHTNSKFPDMKALGDYIHSRGLKSLAFTRRRDRRPARISRRAMVMNSRTPICMLRGVWTT